MHKRRNPERRTEGKWFSMAERRTNDCKVGGACEGCTKNCILIHGRKDPSPIVVSFFKIMISERFSSALFIPPKFAPTIVSLVDQQTYLEDSRGQLWGVKVSVLDDRLVFQQGWHKFASDHSLEIGDLVVFNYIIGSHFVVQVYGRSGCEKLSLTEKSNIQREKTISAKVSLDHLPSDGRNSTATKVPSHTIDKDSVNEQGSCSVVHFDSDVEIIQSEGDVEDVNGVPKSTEKVSHCDNTIARSEPLLPKQNYTEVPFYMIDRDPLNNQGENRDSLFDLSNFEMLRNTSGANGMDNVPVTIEKEKAPVSEVNSVQLQTALETECMEGGCNIIDTEPTCKGASRGVCIDVSEFEMPERKCNVKVTKKVPLGEDKISISNNTSQQPQNASTVDCGQDETVNLGGPDGAFRKGKNPVIVKVEREEMVYPSLKAEGNACEKMETENFNSFGLSSLNSYVLCCAVSTVTQTHLELPMDLLSFSCKGKLKMERMIVLIRDQVMRVWPVMYHERAGFRVLADGWEALAKANNIQQGDVCVFRVDNESEGLFQVSVRRV